MIVDYITTQVRFNKQILYHTFYFHTIKYKLLFGTAGSCCSCRSAILCCLQFVFFLGTLRRDKFRFFWGVRSQTLIIVF